MKTLKKNKARVERPRVEITARFERDLYQVLRQYSFDNRVSINSIIKQGVMMAMAKGLPR